jgi:hypothetical protein
MMTPESSQPDDWISRRATIRRSGDPAISGDIRPRRAIGTTAYDLDDA